jgi:hypothetical protein
MAVFDESTLEDDWQVWQLLRYGPVTLFHKAEVLNETIQYLKHRQYLVFEFDCQNYEDE